MSGLEIALLVVGILFFIGSFFFSEKLSSSDIQTIEKMSEREVNILVEKQLKNASGKIDAKIESRLNESLNRFDKETNKKTTEEIFSISEHAESVLASLDAAVNAEQKTREEVMFLYDRLSDKQDIVTKLENDADRMEASLRAMKLSIEDAIERLEKEQKLSVIVNDAPKAQEVSAPVQKAAAIQEDPEVAELLQSMAEVVGNADSLIRSEEEFMPMAAPAIQAEPVPSTPVSAETLSYEEEIARQLDEELGFTEAESDDSGNINEKIIALHREGFDDLEIAKQLHKGIGEIKLVLGLYDEN